MSSIIYLHINKFEFLLRIHEYYSLAGAAVTDVVWYINKTERCLLEATGTKGQTEARGIRGLAD